MLNFESILSPDTVVCYTDAKRGNSSKQLVFPFQNIRKNNEDKASVSDPLRFDTDPDPRIRTVDYGSGSSSDPRFFSSVAFNLPTTKTKKFPKFLDFAYL